MATYSKDLSRFDLPGLNLPLNWTPNEPYRKYEYDDNHNMQTIEMPAQGHGKGLFPVALNDADMSGGYTQ